MAHPSMQLVSAAISEVVKILLEREVNVNLGMRGESPLEAATVEGHDEVVELLEKHEAIKTKEVTRLSKFSDRLCSSRTLTGLGRHLRGSVHSRGRWLQNLMRKLPCTADGERSLQTPEPYWILGLKRKLCSSLLEVSGSDRSNEPTKLVRRCILCFGTAIWFKKLCSCRAARKRRYRCTIWLFVASFDARFFMFLAPNDAFALRLVAHSTPESPIFSVQ